MLRVEVDASLAPWIPPRLDPCGVMGPGALGCTSQRSYLRRSRPTPGCFIPPAIEIRHSRSEAAARRGKVAHPEMQRQAITQDDQSFLPPEGSLPVETRGRVLGILRRCAAAPNDCFLGARAGYGGAEDLCPAAARFGTRDRGHLRGRHLARRSRCQLRLAGRQGLVPGDRGRSRLDPCRRQQGLY